MQAVEEKITGALNAHRDAVKRLSTGKGNALSIGERIRGLGVKTKRPAPAIQIEGIPIAVSDIEEAEVLPDASPGS
jgi:hypothetical protein